MSKRAEQRALEAYPDGSVYIFGEASWDCRIAMKKGYEQAEKDTIDRVCDWLEKNAVNYNRSESEFDHMEEEMIEELRKAFKEERK